MSQCICGKTGTSKCSKCEKLYCSRDCQVKDWPGHKAECAHRQACLKTRDICRAKLTNNILVMLSHSVLRHPRGGDIHIRINETSEQFVKGGVHFAHISFCPA